MLVKFWDLDTRHCFKTIVSHRSEVNDLILLNDDTRLLTGCHDNELRVFELDFNENDADVDSKHENGTNNLKKKQKKSNDADMDVEKEDDNDSVNENEDQSTLSSMVSCRLIGSIVRESKDPLSQLCPDNTMHLFSSHSANEKHVEIYKANTQDEIRKRLSKKLKKQKRKLATDSQTTEEPTADDADLLAIEQTINDEFTRVCFLKCKHKIKSVDLSTDLNDLTGKKLTAKNDEDDEIMLECKIACLLQNNQIELYLMRLGKQLNKNLTPDLLYTLDTPGHRTDVRTLCFSSDSTAFVTASGDSMKVWNRMSLNCIRTFKCDYALSSLFLSDDNHILIGTKVIFLFWDICFLKYV